MSTNSSGWGPQKVETKHTEAPKLGRLFKPATSTTKKTLKMLVYGKSGRGKTKAILSAPKPIYLIATEPGWQEVVDGLSPEEKKDINIVEAYLIDEKTDEPNPIDSLKLFDQAVKELSLVTEGTIAVDTVSDVWQWIQGWLEMELGNKPQYQFQWGRANSKYTALMLRLITKPLNVILTAKASEAYDDKGKILYGQEYPRAQKDTIHWVAMNIHLKKSPEIPIPGQPIKFTATIEKNRLREMVNGVAKVVEFEVPESGLWNKVIDVLVTDYELSPERFQKA